MMMREQPQFDVSKKETTPIISNQDKRKNDSSRRLWQRLKRWSGTGYRKETRNDWWMTI